MTAPPEGGGPEGGGLKGGGPEGGPPEREAGQEDYTGAVYGSLLAASVVVGAGTLGTYPRLELVALLLGTGVVFWAAHVFSRLFGARMVNRLSWDVIRSTSKEERPIIKAAVPLPLPRPSPRCSAWAPRASPGWRSRSP